MASTSSLPTLSNVRVLLVEDDPAIANQLARMLGRLGAVVDTCGSTAQARQRLSDGAYTIAVIDYNLPGETGTAFARWLMEHAAYQHMLRISHSAREADEVLAGVALADAPAVYNAMCSKEAPVLDLIKTIGHLVASRAPAA